MKVAPYRESVEYAELSNDFRAEVDYILDNNLYVAVIWKHNDTTAWAWRFDDPHWNAECFGFVLTDDGDLRDRYYLKTFDNKKDFENFLEEDRR